MILDIKDFPKPGILFRDITPLLQDKSAFYKMVEDLCAICEKLDMDIDKVVGVESRGFMLAPIVAIDLMAGFVPIRKVGKLPRECYREMCDVEYSHEVLEIHKDSISQGERIILVDDVLATGGTASAAVRLIEKCGGKVEAVIFLVELDYLNGREKLKGYNVQSLYRYNNSF